MKICDVEKHKSYDIDPKKILWKKSLIRKPDTGYLWYDLFGKNKWHGHRIFLKKHSYPWLDDVLWVSEKTWKRIIKSHFDVISF